MCIQPGSGLWPFGAGAIAVLALVAAGCSEPRLEVTGTVTCRGERLTAGTVKIHGPGDRLSTARIEPDGTFILSDVVPGEVVITVEDDPSARPAHPNDPDAGLPSAGGAAEGEGRPVEIPAKYKTPNTTDLVRKIDSRTKHLDITLD